VTARGEAHVLGRGLCSLEYRRMFLEERRGGRAVPPYRVHDVIALLPPGEHVIDDLRRVLQVGVHGDDAITSSMVEPGSQRGLMPEIPGKGDVVNVGIGCSVPPDDLESVVGAAVVDEGDLVGGLPAEDGHQRLEERRDVRSLVVGRNHDRDAWMVRSSVCLCHRVVLVRAPSRAAFSFGRAKNKPHLGTGVDAGTRCPGRAEAGRGQGREVGGRGSRSGSGSRSRQVGVRPAGPEPGGNST
jgi:hypothetical protein